mgnify:CR=1 FL=1
MSFRIGLPPRKRAEGRFIGQVRRELARAFAEEHEQRGLSQSDLARSLDTNRAAVSRRLRGETNLTLRTIAGFAWAMNRRIVFRLVKPDSRTDAAHNESAVVINPAPDRRTGGDSRHTTTRITVDAG